MGKTVPSFRMALEDEIYRWRSFRKALHSAEELEAFDVMMDMARNNAMAGGAACNPIVFQIMSILLAQKKTARPTRKLTQRNTVTNNLR